MKLTWKNVLNSQMFWPADFNECREKAKTMGFVYLAFNGQVFDVNDEKMENPICNESDL